MRRGKIWGVVSTVMLVALGLGCLPAKYQYQRHLDSALARYDGELQAPGLSGPVHIYRDAYAVPHIFAQNEHDLFFAVGFVHAQDRLWQMVLFRAVAEGRTAELFGRIKIPGVSFKGFPLDTLALDRQQRTLGMKFVGEAGAALLREKEPRIFAQLQAYCDGINYFLETHPEWEQLPVEFQILRVKPGPWEPADVISFGRLMGFILGYNMMVELLRSVLLTKYGEELMWEIVPLHDSYGPTIVPAELLKNRLPLPRTDLPPGGRPSREALGGPPLLAAPAAETMFLALDSLRQTISADLPFASNNWVIAPSLSVTGTALLANDPHMPHMQPSIWFMAHLHCPGIDAFGAMFPGTPFIPLGHTRQLAWAATTSIADVQDLFVETPDPVHSDWYQYKGEGRPFTVRREIIRIRQVPGEGLKEEEIEIRQTIHGPVISDFLPLPAGTPPVALRWTAWDFSRDQRLFEALVTSADVEEFMDKVRRLPGLKLGNIAMSMDILLHGKNVEDFFQAMELLDMPSQNWMAADADGNIAYLPGGYVPLRKKGVGALPVPGESGEFDWEAFIPLWELPHAVNPEQGWMVSANNEVVDAEWYPYIFSLNYDAGWRAGRIEELIEKLKPIDMNDMIRIQNDVYVKKAEIEVPMILAAIEKKGSTDPKVLKAAEILRAWDYEADLDTPAPALFFKYAQDMRANILADEVSAHDFEKFLSESHIDIVVELLLKKGNSPLFDDKSTPGIVEDKDDILIKSVKTALTFLEKKYGPDPASWEWGKVHVMKFYHPLGFWPFAELSVYVGPHVGSRHTVRCASPADSGRWHFKAMNGSSWRHLVDLGNIEHALAVIDGSISGQWLSPHYDDLVHIWHDGKYIQAVMERSAVQAQAKYHLVLLPGEGEEESR